jgi:hypothetical protein
MAKSSGEVATENMFLFCSYGVKGYWLFRPSVASFEGVAATPLSTLLYTSPGTISRLARDAFGGAVGEQENWPTC